MNYGKLNEDIYERSVVKVIKTNAKENKQFYNGAEMWDFCAIFPCEQINGLASAQATAGGKNAVLRAYEAALNHIVAKGAFDCADNKAYADISLFIPAKTREIKVREMLAEAVQRADELRIPIANVNVQIMPWVEIETANCVVHTALHDWVKRKGATPGDDIVMTKWIGLEGTALIARSSFDKLKTHYPTDLVEDAADFLKYLSVMPEVATAMKSGASYLQAAREGGIFGGLWELAANNNVGLVVDLKSIPVRQETVEVCEYFDFNPYELMAGGSLLITCPNGGDLVKKLADCGIFSAVIGKITKGNDRLICHEGENRFLEPVRGDEIYRYYTTPVSWRK